jgi:hypothetical protein
VLHFLSQLLFAFVQSVPHRTVLVVLESVGGVTGGLVGAVGGLVGGVVGGGGLVVHVCKSLKHCSGLLQSPEVTQVFLQLILALFQSVPQRTVLDWGGGVLPEVVAGGIPAVWLHWTKPTVLIPKLAK